MLFLHNLIDKRRAFSTIPLQGADLKFMSLKIVLLRALASAKRVSDIVALSVHLLCAQFFSGGLRMILKPNPVFVPKVVCVLPLTLQL